MQNAAQLIETEHTLRARAARRITLLGATTNACQGLLKIVFGYLGHSHSLVADGVHSFSDLVTDLLVLLASHYGSQEADYNHPYGHARIETVATMLLAMVLVLAGMGILWDAGEHFFGKGISQQPNIFVLLVAGLSIAANEIIFHYTLRVSKRVQSNLLRANAWHRRSDSGTSFAVLVGVTGTYFGFTYCDVIAALVVGIMVVRMGWQLGWPSVRELVDTGLDPEVLKSIENSALRVPGVKAILQIRSRMMGSKILVDMHILVESHLSVSEGHYIAQKVHQRLMNDREEITDVTIHVDPEDDEKVKPSINLPARDELIPLLNSRWSGLVGFDTIQSIQLHYLSGEVRVEVYLPLKIVWLEGHDPISLRNDYQKVVRDIEPIHSVDLLFTTSS